MTLPAPTATVTPTETPTPAPAAPAEENDTAKRIAMIAKREKELLTRHEQSKSELDSERKKMMDEVENRKKELEPFEKYRKMDEALKKRDWKSFQELGFGKDEYADFTKSLVSGGEETVETKMMRLREEMRNEFKKELEEKEKKVEEQTKTLIQQRQESAAKEVQNEILERFEADKSGEDPKWPFAGLIDGVDKIAYGVIEQVYNDSAKEDPNGRGRVMKYEEALDLVENQAREEAKKRFGTYEKGMKMLKHLYEVKEDPNAPKTPATPNPASIPNTISRGQAAPSTPTSSTPQRFNPDDSRSEAAKLLKWVK